VWASSRPCAPPGETVFFFDGDVERVRAGAWRTTSVVVSPGLQGATSCALIAWGDLRRGSCSSPGSLRHARLLSLHPPLAEAALPQMVAPGRCIRCRPRSAHFVAVEEAPDGGWEERPECPALAAEADDEPAVVTIRHDRAPVLACCPQVVEKPLPPLQKSLIFSRLDAYMTRAP